jgi:hypothetical protein
MPTAFGVQRRRYHSTKYLSDSFKAGVNIEIVTYGSAQLVNSSTLPWHRIFFSNINNSRGVTPVAHTKGCDQCHQQYDIKHVYLTENVNSVTVVNNIYGTGVLEYIHEKVN